MNAEQVVNKILSEAKAKAEKIVNEAKRRADEMIEETKAELTEYDKQSQQLAQDAARDKRERMLAGARMANAKQLLAARVNILDSVFTEAKEQVRAMPDDQYLDLMKNLLKNAVETGDEEMIIGRDENRLNQDFLKQVNRELGPGFQGNLRLSESRGEFSGGFILSRGRIRVNATIDVLVDQVRQTLEPELIEDLFSENADA
jgi:V/A-type H+-transporting ATPase subunit E